MGKTIKSIGSAIFGGKNQTGALGTGQFVAEKYKIDPNAFRVDGLNSYGQEQAVRGQQQAFIDRLNQQMMGTGGPTLAQLQMQRNTDRNLAQSMGVAASQRGVNPALAARLAAQNAATTNQQAAADSALLRAQEQLDAQQQLGSAIGNMRNQDLAATDRDLQARIGKEQLEVSQTNAANSANQVGFDSASKRRGDLISNIGGGLAAMFSDEDKKKNVQAGNEKAEKFVSSFQGAMKIKDEDKKDEPKKEGSFQSIVAALSDETKKTKTAGGDQKIKSFLDAIKAHSFEYKDDVKGSALAGEGEHLGPMAQELEKTEVGKQMVVDTPEGKVVDYGKGFAAILAAQAMLNEKMKKLEKKKA